MSVTVGSKIPEFVAAMFTALQAATWPTGVQVEENAFDVVTGDAVVIGDTFQEEGETFREYRTYGNLTMDERFAVNVLIQTVGSNTYRDSYTRAFALFDTFQYVLREVGTTGAKTSFGVTSVNWSKVRQPQHITLYNTERATYTTRIATGVQVYARLSIV